MRSSRPEMCPICEERSVQKVRFKGIVDKYREDYAPIKVDDLLAEDWEIAH